MEIHVDKNGNTPIYQQIYQRMRDDIIRGTLAPGAKLPSIRKLAGQLGIARNTIDNAYKQLCVEGYVRARQGFGYIVRDIAFEELKDIGSSSTISNEDVPLDSVK